MSTLFGIECRECDDSGCTECPRYRDWYGYPPSGIRVFVPESDSEGADGAWVDVPGYSDGLRSMILSEGRKIDGSTYSLDGVRYRVTAA